MQIRRAFGLLAAALFALTLAAAEASAKRVEIIISKVGQKMTVKVDGDTEYVWPVSTGAAGYETPSGSYKPFRMEKEHFSKEWDDAPMPHSIFFTTRGHAIHGSYHVKSLGRRASHGCVRLHPDNAAKLFALVSGAGMSNTRVVLKGGLFDFSGPRRSFADVGRDQDKTVKDGGKKKSRGLAFLFGTPKKKVDKKAAKDVKAKPVKGKKVATKKDDAKKPEVKKADAKKVDTKAKKVAEVEVKKPDVKAKKAAPKCVEKDGKKICA